MKIYNNGFFKNHSEIWVEKYRPRTFEDLICDKEIKNKLLSFVKNQDIPNLLFEGPAGTGKSTVSNLLVKGIDCDFKEINAASDNGIEVARTTIFNFCTTSSFSPLKIMVLSEFSEFTPQGQSALRDVMEKHTESTRFIITCNTVDRIIEPIRSRCQEFKIIPPSKEKVYEKCAYILKNENVEYETDEMHKLVDFNYPDIRKCIQSLAQETIDGVLRLNKEYFKLLQYQDFILEIAKTIKPGTSDAVVAAKINEARQILANTKIKNFTQLYRFLFDKIDEYASNKIIQVLLHLEEGLIHDYMIADKEINIVATIIRVFEELAKK